MLKSTYQHTCCVQLMVGSASRRYWCPCSISVADVKQLPFHVMERTSRESRANVERKLDLGERVFPRRRLGQEQFGSV